MEKIRLLPEQELGISENVDKWTRIGLSTSNVPFPDKAAIIRHMNDAYRANGLVPPRKHLCLLSPLQGCTAAFILSLTYSSVKSQLSYKREPLLLSTMTWSQSSGLTDSTLAMNDLLYPLQRNIIEMIKEHVLHQVLLQVRDSVAESIMGQLTGTHISKETIDSVRTTAVVPNFMKPNMDILTPAIFGQHEHDLAYYDYICQDASIIRRLKPLMALATEVGWLWVFDKVCVITPKPVTLHINQRGLLHCEHDMAIKYPDGWGFYALNGVVMKPEHVLTPADQLKPETIRSAVNNIDQHRELLRKITKERMLAYGKVIEENDRYKLIDMAGLFRALQVSRDINYAPYLLMKNPSLENTYHLEGISPQCRTIQQAINWRAGNIGVDWMPEILS